MGKFSDKLKGAFSLKDDYDDDYDDEEFDDEYEDEDDDYEVEEKKEKKGFFSKVTSKPQRQEYEPEPAPAPRQEAAPAPAPRQEAAPAPRYTAPARRSNVNQEVCIFKPSSIEDSREITETLLQGKPVVINFEGLHIEIAQRIIDFISGSCYALDGKLQKISNFIWIATPSNVDISGDFQDLVSGNDNTFDMSGFKSPLY